MSVAEKSPLSLISPSEETDDLDLTDLIMRGPKGRFDGNLTNRVRLWHWVYPSRLEEEDWLMMLRSKRLDWVVVPLTE